MNKNKYFSHLLKIRVVSKNTADLFCTFFLYFIKKKIVLPIFIKEIFDNFGKQDLSNYYPKTMQFFR